MMSDEIGVLLVGYGLAGKVFHAPLTTTTPGLRLHTVITSNAAKVHADYPNVTVETDLAVALANPAIGLVVVATPNTLHAPQAEAALKAGKHVVVDKPFTVTLEEAQKLVALAKDVNRVITVFQNRRWDSDFLTLRALIAEGTLGDIVQFESRFDRYRPDVQGRWREQNEPGSGTWYDLGAHLLDQALVLFGRPQALYADFAEQREGANTTDFFHVFLRYPTLRVTLQASSLVLDNTFRYSLHGIHGSYVKYGLDTQEDALKAGLLPDNPQFGHDPRKGRLTTFKNEVLQTSEIPTVPGNYPTYYAMLRDHLNGLGPSPVPPEQALELMRLLTVAVTSFQQRKELRAL
jgi:predicted dehydrogenase